MNAGAWESPAALPYYMSWKCDTVAQWDEWLKAVGEEKLGVAELLVMHGLREPEALTAIDVNALCEADGQRLRAGRAARGRVLRARAIRVGRP